MYGYELLMMGGKAVRNMYSCNTNKCEIQCVCWFYSGRDMQRFSNTAPVTYTALTVQGKNLSSWLVFQTVCELSAAMAL